MPSMHEHQTRVTSEKRNMWSREVFSPACVAVFTGLYVCDPCRITVLTSSLVCIQRPCVCAERNITNIKEQRENKGPTWRFVDRVRLSDYSDTK